MAVKTTCDDGKTPLDNGSHVLNEWKPKLILELICENKSRQTGTRVERSGWS